MATIKVGKVKSIIFVMMLVISSLFVVANGAVVLAASSGNFDYQYINGDTEVQITGYHGPGGALTIPGSIDGKPVTSIGDSAFYSIASLTSVNIPDSVRSIGDYAFSSCTLLVSVTMYLLIISELFIFNSSIFSHAVKFNCGKNN